MISNQGGKICLVANTDWYLFNFRLALANELRSLGWEVVMVSPDGPYVQKITELGFRWVQWQLDRRGLNLLHEGRTLSRLEKIYWDEKPLMVHHFTIKPVLYGSLAARQAKIPAIVNSITGLGYIFLLGGWKGDLLRKALMPVYRLSLKRENVRVIFENWDDQQTFVSHALVHANQTTIIEGVGVDLEHFTPFPEVDGIPLVVMPARLLWDKGVGVLAEAVRLMPERKPVRVALVGELDPGNPASITQSQLQSWVDEGLFEHWGFRSDMDEVYRQAHIVCLPSMGEGLPTVLIEAAAAGRPIVASDVPGCREVVGHKDNGLLVPPNDPAALAEALAYLASDPGLRQKMGAAGRLKAVEKFASEKIIAETLMVYSGLLKTISNH